jgi:hypothetical protein
MAFVDAQSIRAALARRLALPVESADEQIRETILVKSGTYCGRRFSVHGHVLTWFIEENEVKLIGPDGRLITTCSASLFATPDIARRAA